MADIVINEVSVPPWRCVRSGPKLTMRPLQYAIQITPELSTFSKPFSRFFGLFPMGGRSTAIKLSSGDVWVVASTPFSEETRAAVEKLGTVKYIVAANADHHFFLSARILSSPQPRWLMRTDPFVNSRVERQLPRGQDDRRRDSAQEEEGRVLEVRWGCVSRDHGSPSLMSDYYQSTSPTAKTTLVLRTM